jgi:hypothetical protein
LLEKGLTWMKSDLELKHVLVGLRISGMAASCQLGFRLLVLCVDAGPAELRRLPPPHYRRLVPRLCLVRIATVAASPLSSARSSVVPLSSTA